MLRFKVEHFNSYPSIFHHNGRNGRNRNGIEIKKQYFDQFDANGTFEGRKDKVSYPIPSIPNMHSGLNEKLHIVILNNQEEPGSAIRCLRHLGLTYDVIGKDLKKYNHFIKYETIRNYFRNTIIDKEYTMFLDADDVFIVDGLETLVDTYEETYDCKMLFNSEMFFYPEIKEWNDCGKIKTWEEKVSEENNEEFNPYRYLCSGVWICRTDFLRQLVGKAFVPPRTLSFEGMENDQAFYKKVYHDYYPLIRIDDKCKYFMSTSVNSIYSEKYSQITVEKPLDTPPILW